MHATLYLIGSLDCGDLKNYCSALESFAALIFVFRSYPCFTLVRWTAVLPKIAV